MCHIPTHYPDEDHRFLRFRSQPPNQSKRRRRGYGVSFILLLVPGFTQYPYAVTSANCAIWLTYGIRQALSHGQSDASPSTRDTIINSGVAWVNGIGMVLELLYVALFFKYSPAGDERRRRLKFALAVGFLAFILGAVLFAINDTSASVYCALCGLLVYLVPLYDVLNVLLSRRARYMPPLAIGLVSFANGLAWCIFTGLRADYYMFCPNLAGVLCACVQLVLHGAYTYKMGGCAECEAQDDDPLGEGLMDADAEGFSVVLLRENMALFFSEDPFFI